MPAARGSWRPMWKAERAEILCHYRALVQIDTSNPPGNEKSTAGTWAMAADASPTQSTASALRAAAIQEGGQNAPIAAEERAGSA
jgi:hypothetical protein